MTKTMENNTQKMETAAPAIEHGKPITVEAPTRKEAVAKVRELQRQAEEMGMVQASFGFIGFDPDNADGNPFSTTLIFNDPNIK